MELLTVARDDAASANSAKNDSSITYAAQFPVSKFDIANLVYKSVCSICLGRI